MLDNSSIECVDKFAEALQKQLERIGECGEWGATFKVEKAANSDYWHSKVQVIVEGELEPRSINKNWIQLNGRTYSHRSYSSPKPWKLQARFLLPPVSPLWEKKPPYIYNRPVLEWSLGGPDVWAISYENLAKALSDRKVEDVSDEIIKDLRVSWAYSNKTDIAKGSAYSVQSYGRVRVTISINEKLWSEFEQLYSQRYRSRKKHPKRPSYAELRDSAIDEALKNYVKDAKKREEETAKARLRDQTPE